MCAPHERLKTFRKELELSQDEMANKVSLKQGSYSDIERGRIGVSGILTTLIKVYNINPVWLIEGKGPKTLNDEIPAVNIELIELGDNNKDFEKQDKPDNKELIFDLIDTLVKYESKEERKTLAIELKIAFGRFILENSKLIQKSSELRDQIIRLLERNRHIKNIIFKT